MSLQNNFNFQDPAAERLKTFKMTKNTQSETVTKQEAHLSLNSVNFNRFSGSASVSSSRPTSHHRRRSSVSTRRESAEVMGVSPATLAELPTADEGDTNSLRRRALWALEGKRDDGSYNSYPAGYSKVEIPELSFHTEASVENDRRNQSNPTSKRDSLGRERDSYGRVISQAISLGDQLHTLLEEDEEEEFSPSETSHDNHSGPNISTSSKRAESAPVSANRNRLKPLTLSTASSVVSPVNAPASRPQAPSLSELAMKRRSSLSYRRSEDVNPSVFQPARHALPTPESTPTTSERPLSPSEQAFLFNNQASLLARISELERVLASRSRPLSINSSSSRQMSTSSVFSEAQPDEMLRLVQDLKAERDEVSRDLGLAQSKVENLENQICVLNRRVENERKEAWHAKQNEQALKIENNNLHRELDAANLHITRLKEELERVEEEWRARNQQLLAEVRACGPTHAHRKDISLPSSVEGRSAFSDIGVVPATDDGDDDELAHYEDEHSGDFSNYSDEDDTTTSFGVVQHVLSAPSGGLMPSVTSVASISPPPTPLSAPRAPLKRRSSLEQGWSFPKGARPNKSETPKVDPFFNCLEVPEENDESVPPTLSLTSGNGCGQDRYGFFSSNLDEDEEDFPFILPMQVPQSPVTIKMPHASCEPQVPSPLTPPSPCSPSVNDFFTCNGTVSTAERYSPSQRSPSPQFPPSIFSRASPPNVFVTPTPVRSLKAKPNSPSMIPKPSPARNEVAGIHLATPNSVPRVKILAASPPRGSERHEERLKSPSKLPQPRTGNRNHKLFTLERFVRRKGGE